MKVTFGIFPNLEKKRVLNVLDDLIAFCRKEDIEILLPREIAGQKKCDGFDISESDSMKAIDIGISLGGDGTFLRMAKYTAALEIPVCGINIGRKGFLTEIEVDNMQNDLLNLCTKQYVIEERHMLQSTVLRDGQIVSEANALNDVVLSKGAQATLVRLSVNIDQSDSGAYYSADGVIFSTATGSTAYSLSAGGPIVYPTLPVTIITPICPHALSTRPLVVPVESEVVIKSLPPYGEILLSNDGMCLSTILSNDVVKVKSSNLKSKFIKLDNFSYYDTWQQRLLKGE